MQSIGTKADDLLIKLKQGQTTIKDVLLHNLQSTFNHLNQVLHLSYAFHIKGGNKNRNFPPFLMEESEDLFAFNKILESLETENDLPFSTPGSSNSLLSVKSRLWQVLNADLTDPCRGEYFKGLGDISWKHYLVSNLPGDLDETIWLYGKAVAFILPFSIQSLVPLFGICSALYRRFYLKRDLHDLIHLARYHRQLNRVDFDDLVNQLIVQSISLVRIPGAYRYQRFSLKLREPDSEGWISIPTGSGNTPRKENNIDTDRIYADIFDVFSQAEGKLKS